jgi:arginyl-tRNA synthetase
MIKTKIKEIIEELVQQEVNLEHPANPDFGDYSTNIALQVKIDPQKITSQLQKEPIFEKVEVAGPGFINFTLSRKCLLAELKEIIKKENNYGQLDIGQKEKVQVEFISANPTGPLTVANARGGPFGDVLANVLAKAGYLAEKAYYVNDYGQQIISLGHSVLQDEQAKYQGKYIDDLHKIIKEKDLQKAGAKAASHIIKKYIKKTTDKLGIKYDEWIFESQLYQSGQVDEILNFLQKRGLIYQKEKATWFKSSKFGDSRDRVLIKKDDSKTYLAGDIALHNYKIKDKHFAKVINIWGADHHGDIPGLMAGIEALGYQGKLEIILLQFVTILEKGVRQRMSKRLGRYIPLDELLDEVGPDVVRFFFLEKSPDTHLNFDLQLAREQSAKNPVYYIQYAYARICGILEKTKLKPQIKDVFSEEAELNLIKKLAQFPEIIEKIAQDYQVQQLPAYSLELANSFHQFYEKCRVLDAQQKDLSQARLSLIKATQIVLKNTLELMGITTPEKM